MVALQNLQHILVRASDNAEFTKTTYVNLTNEEEGKKGKIIDAIFRS